MGPLRNTYDDEMSLGELMGLPGASIEFSIQTLLTGNSTHREVAAYRQQQLDKIEQGRAGAGQRLDRLTSDQMRAIVAAVVDAEGMPRTSDRVAAERLQPYVAQALADHGIPGVSVETVRRYLGLLKKV